MAFWIPATITANQAWHSGLFSLQVQPSSTIPFTAGQYLRLALPKPNTAADLILAPQGLNDTNIIHRAYSMVSNPNATTLEFYISTVADGAFTPRLQALTAGAPLWLSANPSGFFQLQHLGEGTTLWLIATGTGLGPYLAMLKTDEPWQKFQRIVLVHGVRNHHDLGYSHWLQQLAQQHPQQFCYVPIISQPTCAITAGELQGRIPARIADGSLEQLAASKLNQQAQIMLCGNPAMIQDVRNLLAARGLAIHSRRKPGNITVEQYWKD